MSLIEVSCSPAFQLSFLSWNLENDTLAYIDFSNGVTHTPTGESELERSDGQKDTVFKDQVHVHTYR